jgi:hypothetical protein
MLQNYQSSLYGWVTSIFLFFVFFLGDRFHSPYMHGVKETTNMSYVHGLNKQQTCHMCMGRTNNKHARKYKTCM